MSARESVTDVMRKAADFLPAQLAEEMVKAISEVSELLEALTVERAMEASGERPSIDDEIAIYVRTNLALTACKGQEQTDGR